MDKRDEPKKQTTNGEIAPCVPVAEVTLRDYVRQVKLHLSRGRQKEAFALLREARVHFPDDPFILSYFGCLQAQVDKRYRSGIEACIKALAAVKQGSSLGEEKLLPLFYLNLGKAYVATGKKKDALETFNKGLKHDIMNRDLQREVQALGRRAAAPVPFLDRSNPINKYVGKILRKQSKTEGKK